MRLRRKRQTDEDWQANTDNHNSDGRDFKYNRLRIWGSWVRILLGAPTFSVT